MQLRVRLFKNHLRRLIAVLMIAGLAATSRNARANGYRLIVADQKAWPGEGVFVGPNRRSSVVLRRTRLPSVSGMDAIPRLSSFARIPGDPNRKGQLCMCSGLDGYIVGFHPRGETLLFATFGQIRHIAATGKPQELLYSIVPTPQNSNPLSDGTVHVANIQSGKWRLVAKIRQSDVGNDWWGAMAARDGRVFIATHGGRGRTATVYALEGGKPRSVFRTKETIAGMAFASNGDLLIANGEDKIIRFDRDFRDRRIVATVPGRQLSHVLVVGVRTGKSAGTAVATGRPAQPIRPRSTPRPIPHRPIRPRPNTSGPSRPTTPRPQSQPLPVAPAMRKGRVEVKLAGSAATRHGRLVLSYHPSRRGAAPTRYVRRIAGQSGASFGRLKPGQYTLIFQANDTRKVTVTPLRHAFLIRGPETVKHNFRVRFRTVVTAERATPTPANGNRRPAGNTRPAIRRFQISGSFHGDKKSRWGTVALYRVRNLKTPLQTRTIRGNQTYRFSNVPPGRYIVKFSQGKADSLVRVTPPQHLVILTRRNVTNRNFQLKRFNAPF